MTLDVMSQVVFKMEAVYIHLFITFIIFKWERVIKPR